MGNSNSGTLDFEYNIVASDYTPTRKLQDFLFGEFLEVKHNTTGEILLLKVKIINDALVYQQLVEQSFQRLSLSHRNLSKINGFAGREASSALSSSSFKIYIYFQPLPRDIARTIKNRKNIFPAHQLNQSKFMTESQLSTIMTQLIDVLEYLQANNVSHGDIRPEAIFMSDDGNLLLCDRRLVYEEEGNVPEPGQEKNILFSPIAFEAYVKKEKDYRENKHKGDVFSLGMTLLECATYKRSAHIYEWMTPPRINKELLYTRLSEMQTRYSQKMCQIVAEMLRFEEHLRPDFVRLKKWIMGTEPVSMLNSSISPVKRNDQYQQQHQQHQYQQQQHQPQPQPQSQPQPFSLGKSMGPKLIGASPYSLNGYVAMNGANQENGKLNLKYLAYEDLPTDSNHQDFDQGKAQKKGKDDEDEVVEFETEETQKKTAPVSDFSHTYQSTNYQNVAPPKLVTVDSTMSTASNTTYDSRATNRNSMDAKNPFEATFGKTESVKMSAPPTSYDYRAPPTPQTSYTYPASGYTSPSFGAAKDFTTPTKQYTSSNNYNTLNATPSTSTETYAHYDNSASKQVSPTFPADNQYSNIHSGLRLGDNRGQSFMQMEEKYKSNYNSQYASPLLLSPNPGSPSYPASNTLAPPTNATNQANNKINNTPSLDLTGETEQWRSLVVDGLTYSTVLSVSQLGNNSPKVGGNTGGDLLSQQLQSFNAPNKSKMYSYSYQNVDQNPDSRTSIDHPDADGFDGTPNFKKTLSGAPAGSMNTLSGSGYYGHGHGHDNGTSYNTSNFAGYSSSVNNSKNNSEMDDIFKKAMERSRNTYNMVTGQDSYKAQSGYGIGGGDTLLDRLGREGITQGYKKY